jgi:hypothetical protein
VFVLTVVNGMNEFMNQGVDDLKGALQGWCNKDLVDGIAGTSFGPTLANVPTPDPSACEATRHERLGQYIALGAKEGFEQFNSGQQPGLSSCMVFHG